MRGKLRENKETEEKEMGKFCTKCGKPLAPGELCSCQMGGGTAGRGAMPNGNVGQGRAAMPNGNMGSGRAAMPNGDVGPMRPVMPNRGAALGNAGGRNVNGMPNGNVGQPYQGAPMGQPGPNSQQYAYQQQVQQQYQQVQQAASGHASQTIGTFLNLVKRPVTTGRQLVAFADKSVVITLILLQALASGFFDLAVMGKLSSLSMGYLRMPYARSFFVTVMLSLVMSFLLAALLLGGSLAVKNAVTYQQALACVAARSALLVVTSLFSILVFVVYPAGGLFFFFTGGLWGMVVMAMILPKCVGASEDKLVLSQFLAALLFLVLFVIMAVLCWKAYLPDALGALGNGLNSIFKNPAGILDGLY